MKHHLFRILTVLLIAFAFVAASGLAMASNPGGSDNNAVLRGDYTALGDSVAAGYGDEAGGGYVGRIYDYLAKNVKDYDIKLNNFGKTSFTSTDLLKSVRKDQEVRKAIENSRFITISIGGNNLLSPVTDAVKKTFGIKTNDVYRLAEEVERVYNSDPLGFLFKVAELMQPNGIPAELEKGIDRFEADWPEIIKEIREIAPEAKIYVSTVFNPLKTGSPFYDIFNEAVSAINEVIKAGAVEEDEHGKQVPRYKIVDVYQAFSDYEGKSPLTKFDLFGGSMDPHPTPEGYGMMYKTHIEEIKKDLPSGNRIVAKIKARKQK